MCRQHAVCGSDFSLSQLAFEFDQDAGIKQQHHVIRGAAHQRLDGIAEIQCPQNVLTELSFCEVSHFPSLVCLCNSLWSRWDSAGAHIVGISLACPYVGDDSVAK